MDVDKLKTSELVVQIMSALVIGCLGIQTGFVMAWPSYNVANFLSNDTVLGTPMSSLHISLLGGLPNLGGLLAMPVCVWAYNSLGRKYGTMFLSLPFIISWVIISLTNNITLILIAVTIAGAGVAGQNISMIYLSEIAHLSIRGAMSSSTSTGFLVGILISYTMGGYLKYMTVVMAHLITSVLTTLLLALLPESPVFLVLVGKEMEAARALSFYRCRDVKSEEVAAEIVKIRLTMNSKLDMLLQDKDQDFDTEDKLIQQMVINDEKEHMSAWQYLLKSKSSRLILVRILTIMTMAILMGGSVLQVYAEPLFAEAVPTMSANQCAIFLALNSLIASVASMILIDKCGRKIILIVASAVAGICTGLLGTQLQLHWAPHWFTVVLIYVYGFMYTGGCAVIPCVLASEVFLPEVRSICNSFFFAFMWIIIFINLFVFNPLVELVGLGFVFYIFCFMCVAGTIYVYFYLPETKGLSVDTIQLTWTIISVTNSVNWILVAMAFGGCGTAGQAACAMYISEIAQDSIRGALTSSVLTIYFLGVLFSYILGGYLAYSQIVYLQLALGVLNIVVLSLLKDSPVYLLNIGKEKEAAESIAFYRQARVTSKQVEMAIIKIKLQLDPRLKKMIEGMSDFTLEDFKLTKDLLSSPEPKKLSEWQFLRQSQSSLRAFMTSLAIMSIMIFMGNIPIQIYAETLFREVVPSFDSNKCSVWLAVDFVVATTLCSLVIDRLGRKLLTIFTCVGCSICMFILATQIQYQWSSEWVTLLMIYLYNFIFNMGIAVMPYVLIGELFLPEVRGLCGSFTMSIGFGLNFFATLIVTPVVDNYSFAPLFYGFTIVGFAGAIFALLFLPETKGLPVDAIQRLFVKKIKIKTGF